MSVKILSVQTFSGRTDTPVVAVTTSGNTDPFSTGTTNVGATGGTIVTSGTYKIHTFTSSGSFVPSVAGTVEILLVGGGGGSASIWKLAGPTVGGGSGGGGAGGLQLADGRVAVEKLALEVVLPTPPLPDVTTIILATSNPFQSGVLMLGWQY